MTFRYSKLKIFYDLLDLIKSNLFILFILFLNSGSNSMFMNIVQWGAIAVFGFSFLFRIYETLFTKVVFAEDGIHIHKGLFSKSEQFIPREKFENVQTKANVLQRLFGVQSITMETGEATSDVTLEFVNKVDCIKIEDYVLRNGNQEQHAEEAINESERQILFTTTIRDILKASLLSFSFLAIIPIGLNIWSDVHPEKYINVDKVMSHLSGWLLILLVLLAVLAAVGIGVFKTFNSYYQYTISMDNERIYVQKGWLSKQSFSIRKDKVQAVIYKQNGYQKLLGVTTIKLISAGEILPSEDQNLNEFFPYLPTEKAHELIAIMLPEFQLRSMTHYASPKAKKLIWLRPPIFASLVAAIGFWKPIFFVFGAIVLVFTYINRIREYRNTAFKLEDAHVQLRSGAFTVETLVTKRAKLLELQFERSLLQRIFDVMSVKLTNRAHPVHVTTLLDIDSSLQPLITSWFEARTKDVEIDPHSQYDSLKQDACPIPSYVEVNSK
ncbi:PH domain-containing protein [Geobacillus sp. E263]|uniref:PH domain-containing protein n=1 Tax=Geobacillus sp. E263 TaxID=391290 RepID=UPI00117BB31A|nr:PH domain-containing protein [Geobacillus sp. E263]